MSTGSNEHTFFSGCPLCKCIFSSRNQSHPPFKCHLHVDSPLTTPHFSSSNLVIPLHCRAEATVSNQGTCVTGCAGKHSLQGQSFKIHVSCAASFWKLAVPCTRAPPPALGLRPRVAAGRLPQVSCVTVPRCQEQTRPQPAQGGRPPRGFLLPLSLAELTEMRSPAAAASFPSALQNEFSLCLYLQKNKHHSNNN